MTFLLPVKIDGAEYQAHAEYTSNAVGTYYEERLKPFSDVFNLGLNVDDPQTPEEELPDTDAIRTQIENGTFHTEMEDALRDLIGVAENGLLEETDPVYPNRTLYLSLEMSASINQLIKTLKAAGADIDISTGTINITPANVVEWKSLAVNSDAIRQVVAFAIDTATDQNRTLQALVELIYVKTGNEILTQNLNDLETALSTTKDSLRTLSQLQELHNKIETTKETQSFEEFASENYSDGLGGRDGAFVQGSGFPGIAEQASIYFQELQPTVDLAKLSNSDTALFLELRNDLIQQISILNVTTPGAGTADDAGSLLDKLRTVKEHIDLAIDKAGGTGDTDQIKEALRYWILDNETDGAEIDGIEPGEIQREITGALSAGQSLNDSQKEEVRRYLFVFEEYYKSAAAILNKITQLLERMAQGIAR